LDASTSSGGRKLVNEHVSWILELHINPEQAGDFDGLLQDMVAATTNETGALDFQWSVSADGKTCHLFERYADSAAALAHAATFRERFMDRFLTVLSPTRFVVYGSPSQEVRDALTSFNPSYMEPAGGFTR
jgi:quinol monooxygenase YgiN